jgi:hypothetical protein
LKTLIGYQKIKNLAMLEKDYSQSPKMTRRSRIRVEALRDPSNGRFRAILGNDLIFGQCLDFHCPPGAAVSLSHPG